MSSMSFRLALAAVTLTSAVVFAAQPAVTTTDFAGTWNIEFMSHQIALVIEPVDATHATATMMMMGRDLALKGALAGRTLTLVRDASVPIAGAAASAEGAAAHGAHPGASGPEPKPIVVTLNQDGTIAGEMMTNRGPGTWTGERLRKRK